MTANEESASSSSASEKSFQAKSEDQACQTEIPSDSVTVVRLKQGHGEDNSQSWWNKRKQRIFRKKTLYMRIPILKWLPKYSAQDFVADLVAGITVGVTVIPQGLAYATVAGLPPEYGLYASYVGCFVYLLFGSTPVVTIGPTALMSLVTYDSGAALMGPEAAILLAFLTGCIVLLFGLLNFGFLIDFIAAPVVAGFTSAAAFTIATTQIEALLGLRFDDEGFLNTWIAVFEHIAETKKWDAVLGFASIAILLLLRVLDQVKLGKEGERKRWQNWVNTTCWLISVSRNAIVIIAASILAYALTEPGQSTYPFTLTGEIPSGFPPFRAPPFSFEADGKTYSFVDICKNLGSSLYISPLVAVIESIAIAKSLAKGSRIDVSQEMIAIGTSNILGSFASSYPVTGAFSRTVVNAASGVRTPFGGLYTGALVLLAITVLTPYFFYIPKSCLAAVIISAVIFMVEVSLVKMVWKSKRIDLVPFGFTFVFCVFVGLSQGILIGTAINLGMLLYSTARPRIKIHKIKNPTTEYLLIIPDRSLVFTAMEYFMSSVRKASALYPGIIVVIDMSHVSAADFTTAYGFDNMIKRLQKHGHKLILTRLKPDVLLILSRMGCDFHMHNEGEDMQILLRDISTRDVCISVDPLSTKNPPVAEHTSLESLSSSVEGNSGTDHVPPVTRVDNHDGTQ
ncbi:sodium-independent sulfate anion transporter-like [Daphnia carinata]|uniref:sodium-independent sulfate anion transporter-like n=1 Tax=Daphnia carinata TaxID=120202 RepID=UPI00257D156E|nr:sodium-independent sulfate anion transporter-like [Daphnia carinata]